MQLINSLKNVESQAQAHALIEQWAAGLVTFSDAGEYIHLLTVREIMPASANVTDAIDGTRYARAYRERIAQVAKTKWLQDRKRQIVLDAYNAALDYIMSEVSELGEATSRQFALNMLHAWCVDPDAVWHRAAATNQEDPTIHRPRKYNSIYD